MLNSELEALDALMAESDKGREVILRADTARLLLNNYRNAQREIEARQLHIAGLLNESRKRIHRIQDLEAGLRVAKGDLLWATGGWRDFQRDPEFDAARRTLAHRIEAIDNLLEAPND